MKYRFWRLTKSGNEREGKVRDERSWCRVERKVFKYGRDDYTAVSICI